MQRFLNPHPLFLFGFVTALFIIGAPAASAEGGCSAADFLVARDFHASSNPDLSSKPFAVADLDGDGRADVAAVDENVRLVAVLLNDGTGRLGAPRRYAIPHKPSDVLAADFNGDGRPDLAVLHWSQTNDADSISILLGSGGGHFGPPTNFSLLTNQAGRVVADDFNGDGRIDLAFFHDRRFLSVLLGDGEGAFAPAPGSPFSGPDAGTPFVADFNSDGKRDLVALSAHGFVWMAGDGAGGFNPAKEVLLEESGWSSIAAADFNGDGKVDVALGSRFSQPVSGLAVLLGDGAGAFSAPTVFDDDTGQGFNWLAAADLDGDGHQDIAAGTPLHGGVTFFKGDGAGGFRRGRTYLTREEVHGGGALGDFDGDGRPDVAAGSSVLLNSGGGDFEAAHVLYESEPTFLSAGRDIQVAHDDFNGDGRADLAVLSVPEFGFGSHLGIRLADGAGGFTPAPDFLIPQHSPLYRLETGDFNRDGKADLAVLGNSFAGVATILMSNGDGTFAAPHDFDLSGFMELPWDLAAGDFDADGRLDLAVVGLDPNSAGIPSRLVTLLGDGAGGFNAVEGPALSGRVKRLAVGDFNRDGLPDLVVANYEAKNVQLLLGAGAGYFLPAPSAVTAGFPAAVTVGDFNRDGNPDVATADHVEPHLYDLGSNVSVLLGDGAGGFAPAVKYERVGIVPLNILNADLDGDGRADLAVGNRDSVVVLSGDGAGGFRRPVSFYTRTWAADLVAHDFDADGRTDLAAALLFPGSVALFRGKSPTAVPCLSADDVTVEEGDSGTSNAEVIVRLSEPSAQVVEVNYIIGGPAPPVRSSGFETANFTGGAGTLTFHPGETAKVVVVPVHGNNVNGREEFVPVRLSGPRNARISDGVAFVTILDDELPAVSIGDATVTEGDSGDTFADFTVTLSHPQSVPITFTYTARGESAAEGSDFGSAAGLLSFDPGVTSLTIRVAVSGDRAYEPDETFFVSINHPTDSTFNWRNVKSQGYGIIRNDDPLLAVSVLDASAPEASGADNTAPVSFRLSAPSTLPVSVDYATADGTADAGSDYGPRSGTITFAPGETLKTVTFPVVDDPFDERDETFFVILSRPLGAALGKAQARFTILDDDGPAVSVGDVSVAEGPGGRTAATLTLTLSHPSAQDVRVRAATADGAAGANDTPPDYEPLSGAVISFPAGSNTATLTLFVLGDLSVESDETFFVNLSEPQNGSVGDGQGAVTIVNDDASVQFAAGALEVNEADGSARLTVTLSEALPVAFTVEYATSGGTASERSDFSAAFGTLHFAPGETSKTITVFVTDDAFVESPETFTVTLSNPSGGPTGTPATAVVTINSEDATAGPNPIDDSAFFVRQHYRDFLGRDPDGPGLAHWVGEIESCGTDQQCREVRRINVSAAFFLSIEFQETGYLAYRMHKAAYGDATSPNVPGTVPVIRLREFLADAGRIGRDVRVGVGDWERQLEENEGAYALEFVRRERFLDDFPASLTAAEFVSRLDARSGGVLSSEERARLIAMLGAEPSDASRRAQVLRQVAEDADLRRAEFNRALVLMQYVGYLRRNPDDPPDADFRGWRFWLDKLEDFDGDFMRAELVKAFISSVEYRQRFGQ